MMNSTLVFDNTSAAAAESVFAHDGRGGGSSSRLSDCVSIPASSQMWSTVFEGVLSVVVGVCGLLGNGATIAVLSRPAFKETFHKLLLSLSVFDSLFIGEIKQLLYKGLSVNN